LNTDAPYALFRKGQGAYNLSEYSEIVVGNKCEKTVLKFLHCEAERGFRGEDTAQLQFEANFQTGSNGFDDLMW
jgi:hypothetical protein